MRITKIQIRDAKFPHAVKEDSDQTARQADLNFRWAHVSKGLLLSFIHGHQTERERERERGSYVLSHHCNNFIDNSSKVMTGVL